VKTVVYQNPLFFQQTNIAVPATPTEDDSDYDTITSRYDLLSVMCLNCFRKMHIFLNTDNVNVMQNSSQKEDRVCLANTVQCRHRKWEKGRS
jgi:hypothetical protein